MNNLTNLLPCPFCGSMPKVENGFSPMESIDYAICTNQDCPLSQETLFTPEEWNRRQPDAQEQIDAAQEELRLCQQDAIKLQAECVALKAELAEARKVIEECRNALAEELSAWDIDPPIHHVQRAYMSCVQWMDSSSKEKTK